MATLQNSVIFIFSIEITWGAFQEFKKHFLFVQTECRLVQAYIK